MEQNGLYERKNWKMKKKIKDLTIEESEKVCFKQDNCTNCPLLLSPCFCFKDLIDYKEIIDFKKINPELLEIEVEDDD